MDTSYHRLHCADMSLVRQFIMEHFVERYGDSLAHSPVDEEGLSNGLSTWDEQDDSALMEYSTKHVGVEFIMVQADYAGTTSEPSGIYAIFKDGVVTFIQGIRWFTDDRPFVFEAYLLSKDWWRGNGDDYHKKQSKHSIIVDETCIYFGEERYRKPQSEQEAECMLYMLGINNQRPEVLDIRRLP